MIRFQGRGFPAPEIHTSFTQQGVTIRVEDMANPEAWVELFIPWDEVDQFQQCQAAIADPDTFIRELDALGITEQLARLDPNALPDVPGVLPPIPPDLPDVPEK